VSLHVGTEIAAPADSQDVAGSLNGWKWAITYGADAAAGLLDGGNVAGPRRPLAVLDRPPPERPGHWAAG